MPPTRLHDVPPVVRRFIEGAGNASQSLGFGRVVGQLYAYLYFSPESRTLSDMVHALGISKGSASMAVRQLDQWAAVRKVWVPGDRKDYYEANDWFGRILRNVVVDTMGKRMEGLTRLIDDAEQAARPGPPDSGADRQDGRFLRDRVERLRSFQKKAQGMWNNPLLRQLMR
jgi:DNA-binding transcriptional regulator GbsR (MarR family)